MGIYRDMFVKHHDRLGLVPRLIDVGAIWSAGYLPTDLRFASHRAVGAPIPKIIRNFHCTIALIVLPMFDLNTSWRGRSFLSLPGRLTGAWTLVWLIAVMMSVLLHQTGSMSRLWAAYWYLGGMIALASTRFASHLLLNIARGVGRSSKQVMIAEFGNSIRNRSFWMDSRFIFWTTTRVVRTGQNVY